MSAPSPVATTDASVEQVTKDVNQIKVTESKMDSKENKADEKDDAGESSDEEDEGEEKEATGEGEKKKKKKKKNKKKKNKEENPDDANKPQVGSSGQTKADNNRRNVENDGSTDEDEPGAEKKSEQQFSKSKKKKLKKKAKQQPLYECIRNAENKFLEFLNEYFVEPNGVPDDVAFMEKFKKVLAMQKSMQLELKPSKPSKEVKEIKEIRDPKTKTTIVKERIEEKGPFGETRIKLQVTLRRHNEEEELSEKDKKKKDRRNRSSINEVFENPGDEFDALKKLISEDMGDKRTQNPSLMNSRHDFDNVKEAIEHVEAIVKNKTEVQQIRNRKVIEAEDLSSLPLHELLERIESRRFRFQDDEEDLDCPLTIN